MKAVTLLRKERKDLREQKATLRKQIREIETEDKAIAQAIEILTHRQNGTTAGRKGRTHRRPRISKEKLAGEVVEVMRDQPNRKWKLSELALGLDRSHSSVARAVFLLGEQERVRLERSENTFLVEYRPTTVRPGEGVR
jgi:tryptophan 2,3-dioxygenase